MKRNISFILTLTMILSAFPISPYAQDAQIEPPEYGREIFDLADEYEADFDSEAELFAASPFTVVSDFENEEEGELSHGYRGENFIINNDQPEIDSFSICSEDGYTALQNAYDNENNKFIFTASQGFGAEAWGRYLRKQTLPVKDFRADLEWARDVYMPANADDPLLGNTISLDNWNEYCEGHTLAPSNHAGFEYLDMIREVFTKAPKEHTDVIPEKRFDQMSAMLW